MSYLKTLMEEREALSATIEGYARKAETDNRDLTDPETSEVKRIQERCAQIDDRLSTFAGAQESSVRYADLITRIGGPKPEERTPEAPETTDLAGAFIESRAYQDWARGGMKSSGVVEIPQIDPLEMRAPITTGASPGSAFMPPKPKLYAAAPADQRPLTALVGKVSVQTNVIDWVTYPAAAPLAAVVAEGAPKPEATLAATVTPVSLETVAHWVQASRQALEDSSALRSFIEGNLSRGVADKIEAQIAAAIAAATGTIPDATAADLLSAIRVGIGKVQSAGFQPNAIALNPADYAAIDVQIMGGTLMGATMQSGYWGLPVVAVGALAAGTALVGNFTDGVTLLNRTGVSIYVTDSHADTFTSNIFTLLAEARAKSLVGQPAALCECTATP